MDLKPLMQEGSLIASLFNVTYIVFGSGLAKYAFDHKEEHN